MLATGGRPHRELRTIWLRKQGVSLDPPNRNNVVLQDMPGGETFRSLHPGVDDIADNSDGGLLQIPHEHKFDDSYPIPPGMHT